MFVEKKNVPALESPIRNLKSKVSSQTRLPSGRSAGNFSVCSAGWPRSSRSSAITNFTRTGNIAELRWQALSGNTPVRIERANNLNGPWTSVAANLTTGEFTDTNTPAGSAFYRVVTE